MLLIGAFSKEERKTICIELRHIGRSETYCDRFGAKGEDPSPTTAPFDPKACPAVRALTPPPQKMS